MKRLFVIICMVFQVCIASTVAKSGDEGAAIIGAWVWKLDVEKPGKARMVVVEQDGILVATVTAPDGVQTQSDDFSFSKGRVSFSIKRDVGPFQIVVSHNGMIKDSMIVGNFEMTGGPFRKSGKWQAMREKE